MVFTVSLRLGSETEVLRYHGRRIVYSTVRESVQRYIPRGFRVWFFKTVVNILRGLPRPLPTPTTESRDVSEGDFTCRRHKQRVQQTFMVVRNP